MRDGDLDGDGFRPAFLDDHSFALCLSHDVDRPYKTYQALYYAVRDRDPWHLTSLLPGRNPYWTYEDVMTLEADLGVRSAFYVLDEQRFFDRPLREWLRPGTVQRYAGRYSIRDPDVVDLLAELDAGGWEVGLHGSYESYRDGERLAGEKRRLESVLGREVVGCRQHYLNLDVPETWRLQRVAGLRYDASLGTATEAGFEHGYGLRRPFDDEFVVFPVTLMDVALPSEGDLESAWADCEALLEEADENDAVMSVDWHPRSFSERDFPNYRTLYRRLVERALEMGAWVGPPGELYDRLDHPSSDARADGSTPTDRSGPTERTDPTDRIDSTDHQSGAGATEAERPVVGAELLDLLNRAFDGWGSERYFRWKYGDFPGYDPETDNFVATNDDGDVVAARRVFERTLRTPDAGSATVHVHGGTVVDRAYRGQGHYSRLLERSMAYSREHADYVVTFNRAGKITTDHHLENGWRHLTLPVRTRVLSPSRVLAHYVIDSDVARTVAGHAAAVDRRLTRSDAVSRVLATAADAVYGDSNGGSGGSDGAGSGGSGHDSVPPTTPDGTCTVEVVDGRELGDDLLEELAAHLRADLDAPYHFERSVKTLRHAGTYPGASVYLARDGDGALRDFLVAGALRKRGFTECRVVEQTWADPAATRRLFERVEADARRDGADVVVTCSDRTPGPGWISMGTEYMMWPPDVGERSLPTAADAWRLTAYDVL